MNRFLILCLSCLLSTISIGQNNYTDFEKESFVEVYMLVKSKAKETINRNDQGLLSKHNILQSRYKEILNTTLVGEKVELTAAEQSFIDEVKEKNVAIGKQKEIILNQLCFEKGIDLQKYNSILNGFKTNLDIQNDLKPIFQKFIIKHGK
jgi:hypothetical protein